MIHQIRATKQRRAWDRWKGKKRKKDVFASRRLYDANYRLNRANPFRPDHFALLAYARSRSPIMQHQHIYVRTSVAFGERILHARPPLLSPSCPRILSYSLVIIIVTLHTHFFTYCRKCVSSHKFARHICDYSNREWLRARIRIIGYADSCWILEILHFTRLS